MTVWMLPSDLAQAIDLMDLTEIQRHALVKIVKSPASQQRMTLFAALDFLEGTIHRQFNQSNTHQEWLGFLEHLDKQCPEGLTLRLMIDNYSTPKHAKVKSWIEWRNHRHPKEHEAGRVVGRLTPTSGSWMNLVERFFKDVIEDVIHEGSFGHVQEPFKYIEHYPRVRNGDPKPYCWNGKGKDVLAKIRNAQANLDESLKDITDCRSLH